MPSTVVALGLTGIASYPLARSLRYMAFAGCLPLRDTPATAKRLPLRNSATGPGSGSGDNAKNLPVLRARNDERHQGFGVCPKLRSAHALESRLEVGDGIEQVLVHDVRRRRADVADEETRRFRQAKLRRGELLLPPCRHDADGLGLLSEGNVEMPLTDEHESFSSGSTADPARAFSPAAAR